jgi:uncharacterized protein (DUF1800 family)
MQLKSRKIAVAILASLLVITASGPSAAGKKKQSSSAPGQMDARKRAVHALNRLTFGPRPGDVDRVMAMGVEAWIDSQLHPEKINDTAMEGRLAAFPTLRMDTRELIQNFPPPQLIRAVENGKMELPSDPAVRAVYESQMERLDRKKEAKKADGAKVAEQDDSESGGKIDDEQSDRRREQRMQAEMKTQQLLELAPDDRMKQLLAMTPEERRALSTSLRGASRDQFVEGMSPRQRETILALGNPQRVVENELIQSKLLRATYSERQLQEVMTDFWFNHFNVFIGKSADRYLLTSYERDVIRPHAMGKFEDLLVATAKSPAMLFYLDNWLSVGANSDIANGIGKTKRKNKSAPVKQAKGKRNGLNENYGRELMELHTLGVNGGYSQKDVTEVARVFTGWTLKQPKDGEAFSFEQRMHEPGEKKVLGHRIKSNGEKEGLEVLHILAHHPSTAKFVCGKLAMRFVSDNPPHALVDAMTRTFLKKDGDIREVLKTMLRSEEFWSESNYRAKVKTPLEFVVSALRASDAQVLDASDIARQLQILGMPVYGMQPPTGYSMKADAWVNSAALLGRMNFALALTAGRLKGTEVGSSEPVSTDSDALLAVLESSLLSGDISLQTHATLAARLQDPKISGRTLDDPARPPNVSTMAGLILGSPEFQRR